MRTKKQMGCNIKGVLHIASGVVGRDVERREVVPLILELWTGRHIEAHAGEDIRYLADIG